MLKHNFKTHTHSHIHSHTLTHTHKHTHTQTKTDTHTLTYTHGATHCFREREVLLTHTHTLIVEKDIVLLQYSWAVGLIKFIDPNDPLSHLPFSFSLFSLLSS